MDDYLNGDLDRMTLTLGAIFALVVGILLGQLGDALFVYQRDLKTTKSSLPSSASYDDRRGVFGFVYNPYQEKLEIDVAAFVDRNEPFVCRGCLPPKRLQFWDSDENILQAAGADASIPVRSAKRQIISTEKGNNKDTTLFRRLEIPPGGKKSAYKQSEMKLQEFFKKYRDPGTTEHLYGAQMPILTHLPKLLDTIRSTSPPGSILEAIGPDPPLSHKPLSMYIGIGPLTTQTHYDSLENFVCVTSGGSKTFDLYDPASASLYMYIDRRKEGNGASVFDENNQDHPISKYAIPTRISLSTGDCLYLPVYWYHSVSTGKDRTISINWWRSPKREKMLDLEHLFCGHKEALVQAARAKCN
jgi:hypothetical protein